MAKLVVKGGSAPAPEPIRGQELINGHVYEVVSPPECKGRLVLAIEKYVEYIPHKDPVFGIRLDTGVAVTNDDFRYIPATNVTLTLENSDA